VAIPTTLSETDVEAARAALVTKAPAASARPVFRLTPRRSAAHGERPLTLVGRPSVPHQSRS